MIRPQTVCDHCNEEIVGVEKVLRVIQTDIYGMDTQLHFCSFNHLSEWVNEQMEDDTVVSVS